MSQGKPVLVESEVRSGQYQVQAYLGAGAGACTAITLNPLGGGPANATGSVPQFDAAELGQTLYVAYVSGGAVYLRHVSLTAPGATWVDDPGPTAGTYDEDITCIADRPSLSAGPDGLYLAWDEQCAGPSYDVHVRKLY
jgi:hypothetical protein